MITRVKLHELKRSCLVFEFYSIICVVFSLVVARYADDGKWYRAWIKSVCTQRQQVTVFFVDVGNESTVMFEDISPCPESVRTLP